jgi:cation/acetate symporter
MIAFYGYDGFLYSIGYLAGWIVALFVVAEPMKKLGRFTFADALDSRFNSSGIKLAAGISTLVVSVFLSDSADGGCWRSGDSAAGV